MYDKNSIFCQRELLILTPEGRRIDLITISSAEGASLMQTEPMLPGLFPQESDADHIPVISTTHATSQNNHDTTSTTSNNTTNHNVHNTNNSHGHNNISSARSSTSKSPRIIHHRNSSITPRKHRRPPVFPEKEVVFISSRVHPGEVPAQHTFKGILNFLLSNDVRAVQLRQNFVFKLIPMLNPDGVFRGHARMDQYGQNLNRWYTSPSPELQPTIYAAKSLIEYYVSLNKLSMYLDIHAASKKSKNCLLSIVYINAYIKIYT